MGRKDLCGMDIFVERLYELREEYEYTQEEIGRVLNLSASSYGYYERGLNEPSLDTLKQIAVFYDVSLDYLLGLIDTPKYPVKYAVSKDLQLMEAELEVVKKLKTTVLPEISKQPVANTERLVRCWRFLQKELKND